jgi:AraC family transcriptional regulator, alkane utilization regulator
MSSAPERFAGALDVASAALPGRGPQLPSALVRTVGKLTRDDWLSELLLRLSVRSSIYCISEMRAPWGFGVAARDIPAFHLLTSGRAWLDVDGSRDSISLDAGDLVILPRGSGHRLRDSQQSKVFWLDDILAERPPVNGRLAYGGAGERTELVCGGFGIDQLPARPLIASLPEVVHLRGHEGRSPEWLSSLIRMISVELAADRPGAEAVVSRLTDVLLAQALRSHVARTGSQTRSLGDAQVAHALRIMREQPNEMWSVPRLAGAVGLSRSAFAARFRAATGEPPMKSLTRFRLEQAASYLRTSNAGVSEIARRTGYESEVSLSKAFRRQYGMAPGAYRQETRVTSARDLAETN